MTRSNLRRGFVQSQVPVVVHHQKHWGFLEPGGRNCRDHGGLLLTNLLFHVCSALIEPRATSPGMVPPTTGWALPHQSLIKKMPYKLAYSLILWKHSLEVPSSRVIFVSGWLETIQHNSLAPHKSRYAAHAYRSKHVVKISWLQFPIIHTRPYLEVDIVGLWSLKYFLAVPLSIPWCTSCIDDITLGQATHSCILRGFVNFCNSLPWLPKEFLLHLSVSISI